MSELSEVCSKCGHLLINHSAANGCTHYSEKDKAECGCDYPTFLKILSSVKTPNATDDDLPMNEAGARLDELRETVVLFLSPDFTSEERQAYVKSRSDALLAASADPPATPTEQCRNCHKPIQLKDGEWFHPNLVGPHCTGLFCDGWPYTTRAQPQSQPLSDRERVTHIIDAFIHEQLEDYPGTTISAMALRVLREGILAAPPATQTGDVRKALMQRIRSSIVNNLASHPPKLTDWQEELVDRIMLEIESLAEFDSQTGDVRKAELRTVLSEHWLIATGDSCVCGAKTATLDAYLNHMVEFVSPLLASAAPTPEPTAPWPLTDRDIFEALEEFGDGKGNYSIKSIQRLREVKNKLNAALEGRTLAAQPGQKGGN
jgi:hypothetical protein